MTNYAFSTLKATGAAADLDRFVDFVATETCDFSLAKVVPPPSGDAFTTDWAVENWGTKWDVEDGTWLTERGQEPDGTDFVVYNLTTAYDPPVPVLSRLSDEFGDSVTLRLAVRYEGEDKTLVTRWPVDEENHKGYFYESSYGILEMLQHVTREGLTKWFTSSIYVGLHAELDEDEPLELSEANPTVEVVAGTERYSFGFGSGADIRLPEGSSLDDYWSWADDVMFHHPEIPEPISVQVNGAIVSHFP